MVLICITAISFIFYLPFNGKHLTTVIRVDICYLFPHESIACYRTCMSLEKMLPSGKSPSWKCPPGKCPRGEVSVEGSLRKGSVRRGSARRGSIPWKCPSVKYPDAEIMRVLS